jgi:hypothetical protein
MMAMTARGIYIDNASRIDGRLRQASMVGRTLKGVESSLEEGQREGGTERRRDREKEGQREEGTERRKDREKEGQREGGRAQQGQRGE